MRLALISPEIMKYALFSLIQLLIFYHLCLFYLTKIMKNKNLRSSHAIAKICQSVHLHMKSRSFCMIKPNSSLVICL